MTRGAARKALAVGDYDREVALSESGSHRLAEKRPCRPLTRPGWHRQVEISVGDHMAHMDRAHMDYHFPIWRSPARLTPALCPICAWTDWHSRAVYRRIGPGSASAGSARRTSLRSLT